MTASVGLCRIERRRTTTESPNGAESRHEMVNGRADLPPLPRGEYEMRVDGLGLKTWRPILVSRDQVIQLELISAIDIGTLIGTGLAIAIGLILIGRRRHRRQTQNALSKDVRARSSSESYAGHGARPRTGAASSRTPQS